MQLRFETTPMGVSSRSTVESSLAPPPRHVDKPTRARREQVDEEEIGSTNARCAQVFPRHMDVDVLLGSDVEDGTFIHSQQANASPLEDGAGS